MVTKIYKNRSNMPTSHGPDTQNKEKSVTSNFYEIQETVIKGKNGTEFKFRGLKHNTTDMKSLEGADICLSSFLK